MHNKKHFCQYVMSQQQDNQGVASLPEKSSGQLNSFRLKSEKVCIHSK